MTLQFTGERIVPGADNCEPTFARKMYQEHIARYEFASTFTVGGDVLDVGCGVGYGSHHLATKGARSVRAFDIAADAVAHARSRFAHPAVTFEVRSALDLDIENAFDVVTCFELIEHVREQEQVIERIYRALRKNGRMLISTPRPHPVKRSRFHEQELPLEAFADLLRRWFATVVPCFEANYFTSFIGRSRPETINNIVPLTDRFSLETADYFVFLASKGDDPDLETSIRPVMTIEDDDYVQTLERDVAVLHDAEDRAKQRIIELEGERVAWRPKADGAQPMDNEPERLRRKLADTMTALANAQSELTARRDEVFTLEILAESLEGVASTAREALEVQTQTLAAANARAEAAEASHAHELGQAQMLHRVLQEHADVLAATDARARAAEAAHAHELGQAQMLHRVLQEHADVLAATDARARAAEAAHAHELGQAQMLHRVLQEHVDALAAERARSEQLLADERQALADSRAGAARNAAELQSTIDAMRSSRVWRLAAPLRRLGGDTSGGNEAR